MEIGSCTGQVVGVDLAVKMEALATLRNHRYRAQAYGGPAGMPTLIGGRPLVACPASLRR